MWLSAKGENIMVGRIIAHLIAATAICIQTPGALGQTKPATSTSPVTKEKSLPFETIKIPGQFGQHENRAQYVVRSQLEWDVLRVDAQLRTPEASIVLPAKPPSVDFETQMVLAAFMGVFRTTGYSLGITKIIENEHKLIVIVRQRSPDWWSDAQGQGFTYPSHLGLNVITGSHL